MFYIYNIHIDVHLQPLDVADTECVVSVAQRPEAIWVLTAAGDIFIRVGLSANSLHGSHWEQLDLHQIGMEETYMISSKITVMPIVMCSNM